MADEFNYDEFIHPIDNPVYQSHLGKEIYWKHNQGKNRNSIELARVVKVYYKHNTVDVVTTLHKEPHIKGYANEGKYSARLPDDFSGVTATGKVYGTVNPITVGSLVAIAFLNGQADAPIIIGSFSDHEVAKKLARTDYISVDEKDKEVQREIWQHFQLLPSMTYTNIDGHGNKQETYPGRSFQYLNVDDHENEYVQDYGFDYEHLPDSEYGDGGGQIEPVKPEHPTELKVFQGVYQNTRLTFFVKGDGTYRIASRHSQRESMEGVTYTEYGTEGEYLIAQLRTEGNPEFLDEVETTDKSTFELSKEGDWELASGTTSFKVTGEEVLINDLSIDPKQLDDRFKRTEQNLTGANESIRIIDGTISLQAERIKEVNGAVVENTGRIEVEAGRIDQRVRRDEFDPLAKGTDNILFGSSFNDLPEGYTEDTGIQVINSEDNPRELIITAGEEFEDEDEVTGIYIGREKPMDMQATFPYTLSFEVVGLGEEDSITFDYLRLAYDVEVIENNEVVGIERTLLPLDDIVVENPIKEDGTIEEKVIAEVTFNAPLEAEGHELYILIGTQKETSESFHITKPMVNQGEGRKEWYPSYREFEVVKRTESSITLLYNELELKVSEEDFNGNEIVARITLVPGAIDLLANEITITADLVKFTDLSGEDIVSFVSGGVIIPNSLSWDTGYGGELTLGGQNDQNGMFQVLTADGEIKVKFDATDGGADIFNVGYLNADNKLETSPMGSGGTIYVRPSEGDDNNTGMSYSQALGSINTAISKIPQHNNGDWLIQISTDGTFYEDVELIGYSGAGTITFNTPGMTSAKAKIEGSFTISGCLHQIDINNLDINATGGSGDSAIGVYHSSHITIDNCRLDCNSASYGICFFTGSNGRARFNQINGSQTSAIRASYTAEVFSHDNTGTGNTFGLSVLGGLIRAVGTQPDGGGVETNAGEIVGTVTYQQPAPAPTTPARNTTALFDASSTGSWRTVQNGWRTDTSFVYQGQYGFGLHRGLWFFGNNIYNAVNGRAISRIEVRLSRRAEGGITGSAGAVVRTHNHPTRPGGQPTLSSDSQTFGYRWGERKWVTLKSALYSHFSTGGARGIGIYTASTNRSVYMIFNTAMQIRITYR